MVRRALVGVLLATSLLGCAREHAAPPPTRPRASPTDVPPYDAGLPPARAVLALVPIGATTLRLVDLAVIRGQVGLPELTSASSAQDRSDFRTRASADAPLLDSGLLLPVDATLRSGYGFGQDDVVWEAHFSGGHRRGWALALRPGLDLGRVRAAVRQGVGPLRGAHVDVADRLVSKGTARPGEQVWASDPRWAPLLPAAGEAFVVRRGCLPASSLSAPDQSGAVLLPLLDPLDGFTVTFGDHVATVRVSRDRPDLFDRLRAARTWPVAAGERFGSVFSNGVGDPSTGRIGYDVPRPARAATLVRRGLLPVGVCGPPA